MDDRDIDSGGEAGQNRVPSLTRRARWFFVAGVLLVLSGGVYLYYQGQRFDADDGPFPNWLQNVER